MLPIDYNALTVSIQAQADDASNDEKYVVENPPNVDALGCKLDGTPEENARRIEMMAIIAVQNVCVWRANGGVGRMLVFAKPGKKPNSLEIDFVVVTDVGQIFGLLREHAV